MNSDSSVTLQVGETCTLCSAPVDPHDRFCPSCGESRSSLEENALEGTAATTLRCENCGATIHWEEDSRSTVCPFCASSIVVELATGAESRQRPEFVIPFAVEPESAQRIYRQWLGRGDWFRPSGFTKSAAQVRLKGIYLPFWSFSVRAESDWSVRIGEYWYRTETYTVTVTRNGRPTTETRTRTVQETEWWPLQGRHRLKADPKEEYIISGGLEGVVRSLVLKKAELLLKYKSSFDEFPNADYSYLKE